MDTMARREDDGGHGYDDGAATGASAMVGNNEGREIGGMACPGAAGCDVEASRGVGVKQLTPWPPSGEEATGWRGPAQCWAARWAGG